MSDLEIVETVVWNIVDRNGQRRRLELVKYVSVVVRASGPIGCDWLLALGGPQLKARTLGELKSDILDYYGGKRPDRPPIASRRCRPEGRRGRTSAIAWDIGESHSTVECLPKRQPEGRREEGGITFCFRKPEARRALPGPSPVVPTSARLRGRRKLRC